MTLRAIFCLVFLCGAMTFGTSALTHSEGYSYVYLNIGENSIGGRIEVLLGDLTDDLNLDQNADGFVSKDELTTNAKQLYDAARQQLTFHVDGQALKISVRSHDFLDVQYGSYALLRFDVAGIEKLPDAIDVEHVNTTTQATRTQVMLLIESNQRIGLADNESQPTLIFARGQDRQTISLLGETGLEAFQRFLVQGVIHIAIGYDHVLFLITLLLPSVLILQQGKWAPALRFRQAFFNVLTMVTLFTIAHSITLSLAALDLIKLPARLVESLIAFSIIILAIANLRAWRGTGTYAAVFFLGLLHGFGFAYVLAPLAIADRTLVTSLTAFNLGVEFGQISIILATFPILYTLRKWRYYVQVVVWGVSTIAAIVATGWFVRRAFDVCDLLNRLEIGVNLCTS